LNHNRIETDYLRKKTKTRPGPLQAHGKTAVFFCRESGCDGAGQTLLSATALTFLEALWQERSIGEAGSSLNSMLNVSLVGGQQVLICEGLLAQQPSIFRQTRLTQG